VENGICRDQGKSEILGEALEYTTKSFSRQRGLDLDLKTGAFAGCHKNYLSRPRLFLREFDNERDLNSGIDPKINALYMKNALPSREIASGIKVREISENRVLSFDGKSCLYVTLR